MAFGQLEPGIVRQAAEHRLGKTVVAGAAQQLRMALAGYPVEDDAGHLDIVAMAGEPFDQRGRRGAHAARVHHQDDRQVEQAGEVGGRAAAVVGAVEQTHHALADHQRGIPGQIVGQAGQGLDAHRPAVQIDARPAAGAGVERRIDVVGADLERSGGDAAAGAARAAAPGSAWSCRCRRPAPRRSARVRSCGCIHQLVEPTLFRNDQCAGHGKSLARAGGALKRALESGGGTMGRTPEGELRRGWTTGACAAAATKAAYLALLTGRFPDPGNDPAAGRPAPELRFVRDLAPAQARDGGGDQGCRRRSGRDPWRRDPRHGVSRRARLGRAVHRRAKGSAW